MNQAASNTWRNTAFDRRHLAALPAVPCSSLSDISRIPFTFSSDLANRADRLLAVRQDEVARIVTLRTSGSTGEAKRVFFTEDDRS